MVVPAALGVGPFGVLGPRSEVPDLFGPDGMVGRDEEDDPPGAPGRESADVPGDDAPDPGVPDAADGDAEPDGAGDDAPPDVPGEPGVDPEGGCNPVVAGVTGTAGLTVADGCGGCGDDIAGVLYAPVCEFVFCGGTGADGGNTSTDKVKVRFSAACNAPTFTT